MSNKERIYSIDGNSIHEYYSNKDDLIHDLSILARLGKFVFRGYSKQDQLLPNIIRDKNLTLHEKYFLNEFEKYGSHYFSANNPTDLLSYAQHYGLPTRLLDFTYNPFIALSFALFANKGPKYKEYEDRDFYYLLFCDLTKHILVRGFPEFFGLEFRDFSSNSLSNQCYNLISEFVRFAKNEDPAHINDYAAGLKSCDYESTIDLDEYVEKFKEKLQNKRLCFLDTNQTNQRIIMQQGLFMLPLNLNSEEHLRLISDNTHLIKISKSLRGDLLAYLDTLGYNTFRLMPDLPSVCAAITQRVKDPS